MQLLHTHILGLTAVAAALALAGCGGGSSPNPDNDGPFTVDGIVERTDFFDSNDDRYYDIFQTDVTRDGTAEVELTSRDFDAQIFVYRRNSNGDYSSNPTTENDDIDSSTSNARVRFDVRRGEIYRVIVTSSRAREFGDYRVFFSRELGRPAVVLPKTNGRSATGFDLPAITPKAAKSAN